MEEEMKEQKEEPVEEILEEGTDARRNRIPEKRKIKGTNKTLILFIFAEVFKVIKKNLAKICF
jgi:hypothetical protein